MEFPDYLERQEGPDGQFCDLLKRIPYDRQRTLELFLSRARSEQDQQDAALHALLWTEHQPPHVKDALTGEWTEDIEAASADLVQRWRLRAMELYNEWYAVAYPGPKESTRTGRRTGSSARTSERLATDVPA